MRLFTRFSAALQRFTRPLVAVAAGFGLSGCVYSASSILTGGKPEFGQQATFQLYSIHGGAVRDPQRAQFRWDGTRYSAVKGEIKETGGLTIHPLEGRDYIVQSIESKDATRIDYAIARRLAQGVYLVFAIDHHDADDATRAKYCAKGTSCKVDSKEALLAFARAAVAKPRDDGGLALLLAGEKKP